MGDQVSNFPINVGLSEIDTMRLLNHLPFILFPLAYTKSMQFIPKAN